MRVLLIVVGLLLSFSRYGIAAGNPGRPADNPLPVTYNVIITPTAVDQIANSGNQDAITVEVDDASTGLPVVGVPIKFTIVSNGLQSTLGSQNPTVSYGFANATVTTQMIKITVAGVDYFTSFNYIAGPPDLSTSYLKVIQGAATANGTSQDIVEAFVYDAYGNAIADGTPITFSILGGTATLSNTGTVSGGTSTATLTSNTVGNVQVQAVVGGITLTDQANPSNNYATVKFVPDIPNPANSYVSVFQNPVTADGTSQDIVKAYVYDQFGNPVADGSSVVFVIQSGTATMTTTGTTTGGIATASFTSTIVGSVVVQAYVGGFAIKDLANPGNNYVTIQFVIGPPDPSKSYLQVTADNAAADGTSQDIVKAFIYDSYGHPEPDGTAVTLTIQSGTATMTTTGVTIGGVATATFTSTLVGPVTVQGVLNGTYLNDLANPANNFVTIHFVPQQPNQSTSYITVTQDNAADDGVGQDKVQAVVKDINGNLVADGTVVTFSIQSGTATMTVSGTTVNGIVTATFTSTTAGPVVVQGQTNGFFLNDQANPGNNFVTIHFVPQVPALATSYLTVTADNALADGTSQDIVQAVVHDASNQPVADGTVVTFTIQTGTATMTTTGVTVGGIATATFTSTTVGSVVVTGQTGGLTLNDQANPANGFVTVHFVPQLPNQATSYLTVTADNAADDGVGQDKVQAVVKDINGNPVADGTVVTFTIQTGTATMTTTGVTVGGIATATFTSTTAGPVVVQGQTNGFFLTDQAAPANNFVTVHFVPQAPAQATSYLTVTADNAADDGTSQDIVQAVVHDASNQPVADGTVVTFTIQTGAATMTTTGVTVNGIATATFTSTTVGSVVVTGQTGGLTLNDQANPANGFVTIHFVTLPPNQSTSYLTVTQDNATDDGTAQDIVQAVVKDINGNPVGDGTVVTFTIQTGTATMTTTGVTVGGIATATFTSTTVGPVVVTGQTGGLTLTDQANPANGFVTVHFVPQAPAQATSYLTVTADNAAADGTSQDIVQAVVRDASNQPVADGTVVTFTIQTGTATMTTTGVTVNGVATATFTSTTVGPVVVTGQTGGLTLTDQANPTNGFVTVHFVPLPPNQANSYLTVTADNAADDGTSQDIVQAVVHDALNQPVPDGTVVTFTIQTGTATMTTTGVTVGGIATATFTSTTIGPVVVTGQTGGLTLTDQANPANGFVTVHFVPQAPAQATSYLTVTADNALADGGSQDIVQAVVHDASNQPVADGTVVTFTIQTGAATMTTTGVTVNGIATATFVSTTVGPVVVTGQTGGLTLTDQANPANGFVTIHFVPLPPNQSTSYITVTADNAADNGVGQDIVQAVVKDLNGNLVADGTVVTFSIQTGTATMTVSGTTVNGIVTATFTSFTAGPVVVQAQTNGFFLDDQANPTNDFVTIHFIPQAPAQATSYLTVTADNAAVDGTSQDVVQAVVHDASNQPVADGTVVTFTIQTGAATMTTTGVTVNGIATATFVSTTVGSVIVIGSTGGLTLTDQANPANGFVTIHFVPLPPNQANSYLTVTQDNALDNGTAQDIVQAVVKDINGNAVADGTVVTFAIQTGTATMTTTGVTVGGIATATFVSTTAAPVVVNGQTNGFFLTDQANPTNNFVTIHFVPQAPAQATSYLTVTADNAPIDGTTQNIVQAVVHDASNQPVADGTVVTFQIQTGTATMTTTGVTVNGIATATFVSTTVGPVVVNGQTNGFFLTDQANPANNFVTIHFVPLPPNQATSYITVTADNAADNGVGQDIVQAVVKDINGNLVADGTVVTFSIKSGTANMTISGTTVNGVVTATFTSFTAGPVVVQAKTNGFFLDDQANPTNDFVTIHFTLGPPAQATSYLTITQNNAAADGTSQDIVQAVVKDAGGNLVADGTVVTFSIQSGTATMTVSGTTVNGIVTATFTSTVAAPVVVQAQTNGFYITDQNTPINDFVTILFTPTQPDATKSYVVVTNDNAIADAVGQDIVHAVINNSAGQPVADGTVVTFTIQTGTATMTTTGKTVGGIATATFTSTVVGAVQVQANLGGTMLNDKNTPANNFVTIHFVTGPPVPGDPSGPNGGGNTGGGTTNPPNTKGYTVLYVVYDHRLADGTQKDSVVAYVTDAEKHPVSGADIQFSIQTSPAAGTATGAQLVGNTTVTSNANGFAGMAVTSTTPGTVFIAATLNGVPIDGSYQIITFDTAPDVTNPLTSLTTIIYEALADGTSRTEVKAHVVDLDGLIMSGQDVTFSIDSGSAQFAGSQTVQTDANGDAYIYITSKTPGDVLITATVDGKPIIFGSPARVHFTPINIYVPRVFTPNNDGTNDILKPILVGISAFHYFSVYNRWGNLIFTTQDANQGWDGTFRGVPQPVETYLWIGEGIDVNGKKIVQRGMVSLVR